MVAILEATICISNYALYLALSPNGNTLYVSEDPSNSGAPCVVEVYDVTDPTNPSLRTTLTVGDDVEGLAVSPDGTKLYVTNGSPLYSIARTGEASNFMSVQRGSIYVFNTATYKQTNKIICNGSPFQVLFIENGAQADVLNQGGTGFIQFIQVASGKLSNSTGAGGGIFDPAGMVTDASGGILCVADNSNYVAVCNPTDGTVSAIYPAVSSVFDLAFLGQPALTPNGQYLYVPYGRGSIAINNATMRLGPSNNQVVMLNVTAGQIIGSLITVGYDPVWAQVSPNGNTLYVANNSDGTVSVIDIIPN
jgi:DNA-binding beta-propeller fold protein YncE